MHCEQNRIFMKVGAQAQRQLFNIHGGRVGSPHLQARLLVLVSESDQNTASHLINKTTAGTIFCDDLYSIPMLQHFTTVCIMGRAMSQRPFLLLKLIAVLLLRVNCMWVTRVQQQSTLQTLSSFMLRKHWLLSWISSAGERIEGSLNGQSPL